MQSVNSPDGRCRVMLLMEWCGVVWSGVCVCVLCPWGSILMMVGKRVQVAGTAWRSVSLESGVWSMEFWRFEARGDENVPAVQSQSHQTPHRLTYNYLPTTATSVVPVVHLMPPRCAEHGRYMQH